MKFEDNVYALIKNLKNFEYRIESIDHIWTIMFHDKKDKWHRIDITKYKDTYYLSQINGNLCILEIKLNKSVEVMEGFGKSHYDDWSHDPAKGWNDLILYAIKWQKHTQRNWIKANQQVQQHYPIEYRKGIVPHLLVRASIPDIHRIDKQLGKAKTKKFIKLVESNYFHDNDKTTRSTMTANDFFDYCKIAYIAGVSKFFKEKVDEELTGREMYKIYADGRDEGLLEIDPASEQEFADWIDHKHTKRGGGGHPWEIKRGGNTTHISLYVSRPRYSNDGYKITLAGAAITRLLETINMFLAIYDAGLPITIADPEGIRKRLLAHDNIGILPEYQYLHRGNQSFYEHEDVFDVMHLHDMGRYKRRIKPFISWEPLPLLRPVNPC